PSEQPIGRQAIDPLDLMLQSSGGVRVVLLILIAASFAVWVIWFLKAFQLGRMSRAQHEFEHASRAASGVAELMGLARQHPGAPGAHIVRELGKRRAQPNLSAELLMSVAKRA